MSSVEHLKATLIAHEDLGDDAFPSIDGIVAGARRRRRHRALGGALATVAVLVAGALVASTVGVPGLSRTRRPSAPATKPSSFAPLMYNLTLAPNNDFELNQTFVKPKYQEFTTGRLHYSGPYPDGAAVFLYDTDAFDSTKLKAGRSITVQGHPAYEVDDWTGPTFSVTQKTSTHAIGWQDPSGRWVLVISTGNSPGLATVAADVRVTEDKPVRMPFHLGWLPPNLKGSSTATFKFRTDDSGASTFMTLGPLSIDTYHWFTTPPIGPLGNPTTPPTRIGDYDTWKDPRDPGSIIVHVGTCFVSIGSLKAVVTYADLEHIVRSATITDCDHPSTWLPPV